MTGRPRRKTSVRRNTAAIIQDRAEAENDPQREQSTQLWASHKTVVRGLAWSTLRSGTSVHPVLRPGRRTE